MVFPLHESFPSLVFPDIEQVPYQLDIGPLHVLPEHLYPLLLPEPHESLLLSGGNHPLSHHSYIGLDPFLVLSARGNSVCLEDLAANRKETSTADPFEVLRALLVHYPMEPVVGSPVFRGGGIGYLSYELGRHLERLPCTTEDDLDLPEIYFAFSRSVLCYSHLEQTYTLYGFEPSKGVRMADNASHRARLLERIETAHRNDSHWDRPHSSSLPFRLESHFSRTKYLDAIRRILHYIREGDIYQVNLSQRFQTPYNGDPYGLFLKLFEINPTPFFAYLNPGPFQVISSSPERFLSLNGDGVETRPIKGTAPRGRTLEEDRSNRESLLCSEKNRAELAMITDLLRNDLGRVCEYGSVEVKDAVQLEAYTNVFHLLSTVTGRLAKGRNVVDLLRATFPGGSITGCPKIRSMEIIDELEPTARAVYTGSIGYLGWDGSMDMNIAIRTLLLKENRLYYQVGGGIVYDSDPQAEYEETLHKAASMKEALIATCERIH